LTDSPPANTPKVALVKAETYDSEIIASAIEKVFSLLGGTEKFVTAGDHVLIKPNLIAPRPNESAVQTHASVILEITRVLKDMGAKPFIADSPAWKNTRACIKIIGLEEPLKKLGAGVCQLNNGKRIKIAGSGIAVSSVALEADKIINVPKFKTHQQLTATFAVKNIFGCVPGKEKAFWHFARGNSHHDFCEMLLEIYKLLNPVINIIDAVIAMEGMGPLSGTPRKLGCLVASSDPIACEFVCAKLIDMEPQELPIVNAAKKIGFGCCDPDSIEILGNNVSELKCPDFKRAETTPLRFSFPRICKSAAKQLYFLAKEAVGGNKHR